MNWKGLRRMFLTLDELQSLKKSGQSSSSMQAVQDLQRNLPEDDRFLIYTITNRDTTTVFKTSRFLLCLTSDMDMNGEHYLVEEFAFFDAMHGRVKAHATFSLHVYHPLVRKLIRIASMELPSESTKTIAFFVRMLNEGMTEWAGKAIHFNPHGMVCDE